MVADGDAIDADYQVRLQESLPVYIIPLSVTERESLSEAAKRRLDDIKAGPDEYGHDNGVLVPDDQRAFLAAVASGDLYDGLSP